MGPVAVVAVAVVVVGLGGLVALEVLLVWRPMLSHAEAPKR